MRSILLRLLWRTSLRIWYVATTRPTSLKPLGFFRHIGCLCDEVLTKTKTIFVKQNKKAAYRHVGSRPLSLLTDLYASALFIRMHGHMLRLLVVLKSCLRSCRSRQCKRSRDSRKARHLLDEYKQKQV